MKHYIIPYVVVDKGWWTAVDFYNHSNNETAVTIKVQRFSNGVIAKTITEIIYPHQHYILLPKDIEKGLMEPDGRATLFIDCSEDVFLTSYQASDTGFAILPHYEDKHLKN